MLDYKKNNNNKKKNHNTSIKMYIEKDKTKTSISCFLCVTSSGVIHSKH